MGGKGGGLGGCSAVSGGRGQYWGSVLMLGRVERGGGLGLGMEVVGGGHGGRAGGRPASIILINSKGTHSVPNLSLQLAARLQ